MDTNSSTFRSAERAYLTPPDDDDNICPDCDGKGCTDADIHQGIHAEICSTCKGHGTMDAVRAENELERRIEQFELGRESSEGNCL